MSTLTDHPAVISPDGTRGYVEADAPRGVEGNLEVLVNFENGQRLWVAAENLILQKGGHYQLQSSPVRSFEATARVDGESTQPLPRPVPVEPLSAPADPRERVPIAEDDRLA